MKIILGLFLLAFPPGPAYSHDQDPMNNWAHWRGPLANGVAPRGDPPVEWSDTKNIKWKAEIGGKGSSSPIVWADQVFVLTAIKIDRPVTPADLPKPDPRFETKTNAPASFYQFVVMSFDRYTGKLRWKKVATEQVPHEGHHPTHSYAAGSPTTDGKYLYVSFGSRGTYCYDLKGNLIWKRDLGILHTRLGWGEAVTPVIYGDSLLLNWDQEADSMLYCLDAKTGETRWKTAREEHSSWNTPLVVEFGGTTSVVVNGTNRVRAYDLANGKELWQCGGMTVNAIPSPVTQNGVVYCMSGYKGSLACAISLDSKGDITDTDKALWRHKQGTPYVGSPLLVGDRLYFTDDTKPFLTSLDIQTGKPVLDHVRLAGQNSFYASPVAAADRIYLVDREGTTLVIKAGTNKLTILASNKLDDTFDASPAIVGKQLFLRGEKALYCIEKD